MMERIAPYAVLFGAMMGRIAPYGATGLFFFAQKGLRVQPFS
jgi:hypothetical protein